MNITSEKAGKATIKLIVELTESEMAKYYDKTIETLSKQIKIKGFRPGKIPREAVEKQVEKPFIMAKMIDLAIPPTYIEAIRQEKIEPIAQPKVKILTESPLKYEAIVPIYPEVKLKDYKKIKLERKKVEVNEEQVNEELEHFKTYHATYADVNRPAALGDRVEIDFEGFDEGGALLEGTTSKNHPMILGDKSLVPGFEEEITGMKIGEEKEFAVTFPKDYFHKPFQSKPVKFKVKLGRLEERHLPVIDAEFIKKVTGKEMTDAEFRQEIKTNLEKNLLQEETNRLETELLEKIRDNTDVELAEGLIDEEIHYILDEIKANASSKGIQWEDYQKAVNKTEAQMHDEKQEEAKQRLRLRFGVQEVFKLENIAVSDEEINKAFEEEMKILASMNYEPKVEEHQMLKSRLLNKIRLEKLINLFIK